MTVTIGKPFDVLRLKGADLEETRAYADDLAKLARRLYGDGNSRRVPKCPACDVDARNAREVMTIFGVGYVQCLSCAHVFVGRQVEPAVFAKVFTETADHSAPYVDREGAERRVVEIVMPKIDWLANVYRDAVGGAIRRCIDVGAGGGHFVAAMNRLGVETEGYELSQVSRQFAQEAFGVDLRDADFAAATPERVDLVTMWGLLEYVPEPRRVLEAARKWMETKPGLLVVEVPRFDALGTYAQMAPDAVIGRHMDPTSHVNCFSDSSIATTLVETGFAPVAAWYFGMDAYELLMQAALRADDPALIVRSTDIIPLLQQACDRARYCDDLVIAAVPVA